MSEHQTLTVTANEAAPAKVADHAALVALFSAGKMQALMEAAQLRTQVHPDDAFAWKALALALQGLSRADEALNAQRTALDLQPDDWEGQLNFGVLLQAAEQYDQAEQAYRLVLASQPEQALAHRNLGLLMLRRGRYLEAEASLRQAMTLQPGLPETREGLSRVLEGMGRLREAEEVLLPVLQADPGNASLVLIIAKLIEQQGRLVEAEALYRHLTETQSTFAEAHNNLGIVLQRLGHLHESERCFRRALNLMPRSAEVLSNLGNILSQLGRGVEAQSSFRRALALKPDFFIAHSNLLGAMNEDPNLTPGACLTEARRYGKRASEAVLTRYTDWHCDPEPAKLKIGFVSGDLRRHPVGYFIQGLVDHFDQDRFEFIAYVTSTISDDLTERFKKRFSAWHSLNNLSDAEAAARIHADGVHILVDLAGHTADNRLPVFAYKPAPVQVSWLGYFATTGVEEIDWYIADETGVPKDNQNQFSEAIWYLPHTRLCFAPPDHAPAVAPLPQLTSGRLCLGSFQNLSKLNDQVLRLWARVLEELPQAFLRIQARQLNSDEDKNAFIHRLVANGIKQDRVKLCDPTPREEYLRAYSEVDLVLDTFPYCGGTTSCEALWMGVPTLTLTGQTQIARQGASLMQAANLPEWVAESEDQYISKLVRFAAAPHELDKIRQELRTRVIQSPLFDQVSFTNTIEKAFEAMWSMSRMKF